MPSEAFFFNFPLATHNLPLSLKGRWLSPDPAGGDVDNPQSLNRYAYALNNPTTLTDHLGLDASMPSNGYYCPSEGNCVWMSGSEGYNPYNILTCQGVTIDAGAQFEKMNTDFNEGEAQYVANICMECIWVTYTDGSQEYARQFANLDDSYDWITQTRSDIDWYNKTYGDQNAINGQCGSVTANLASDFPNSGASVTCGDLKYIQGAHANFPVSCGTAGVTDPDTGMFDCSGRYRGGLHVEGNPTQGFWGHNDTASPYIGPSFNLATFNPLYLAAHGVVDVLLGNFIYMFPH